MNTVLKIVSYQLQDAIRNRWVILYTLLFLVATEVMLQFGGTGSRLIVSLMNLVLILIPLVSIVFGTIYVHHSRDFIELLLSQPVSRPSLFGGLYVGLALPLAAGFAVGVGLPLVIHGAVITGDHASTFVWLLATGILLTLVFTALALVVALRSENRVQAVGMALLLWFFFSVMYDGLVLILSYSLSAYPLERLMREIRRRTRVVGAFPDGKSALMLVAARLRHVAGTKWGSRRYLNMERLKEQQLEIA